MVDNSQPNHIVPNFGSFKSTSSSPLDNNQGSFKWARDFIEKHQVEEKEEDVYSDEGSETSSRDSSGHKDKSHTHGRKKHNKRISKRQRILDIIADDEEKNRTSSYEININKDVELFLDMNGLDFLKEYFIDKADVTMESLHEMTKEQLEVILEGKLYAKRLRDELNKAKI